MLIKLIREAPKGDAIFGRLIVDNSQLTMDTLEHRVYAIPAGFYRMRLSYSPRFKEILPLLDHVIGYACDPHSGKPRTGIRIHAGNTIEHTTGCILVGEADQARLIASSPNRLLSSRKCLHELREYLLTNQTLHPYEEMYIEITEPDPYPHAGIKCPPELQKR